MIDLFGWTYRHFSSRSTLLLRVQSVMWWRPFGQSWYQFGDFSPGHLFQLEQSFILCLRAARLPSLTLLLRMPLILLSHSLIILLHNFSYLISHSWHFIGSFGFESLSCGTSRFPFTSYGPTLSFAVSFLRFTCCLPHSLLHFTWPWTDISSASNTAHNNGRT